MMLYLQASLKKILKRLCDLFMKKLPKMVFSRPLLVLTFEQKTVADLYQELCRK